MKTISNDTKSYTELITIEYIFIMRKRTVIDIRAAKVCSTYTDRIFFSNEEKKRIEKRKELTKEIKELLCAKK